MGLELFSSPGWARLAVGEQSAGSQKGPHDWLKRHTHSLRPHIFRSLLSVVLTLGILEVCRALPNMDHATVALLLVAATAAFAIRWGLLEAIAGAVAGAIGLAYYFLPPNGFSIANPEHVVALAMFLLMAIVVGQLAARAKHLLVQRDKLLNLSPDPLCIRNLNGDFQSANEAVVKILGWSAEELRSRPFLEFVHPEDRTKTKEAHNRLTDGRGVIDFENRYQTKDGRWRWLNWTLSAPGNGESQVSAAARDVTEEKLARQKLHDLAAQLMTAQDQERRRIARELHDDVTQRLASLGIELDLLKQKGFGVATEEPTEALDLFQARITQLTEDLRLLSHSLHPSILEYSDLSTTLEMHCRKFTEQYGIAASFSARQVPADIPHFVAVTLYRIAQEALRNVAEHSGANTASIALVGDGAKLSLSILDDGGGFDTLATKLGPGLGLLSIEERVRNIGAELIIDSSPESGTRLTVRAPVIAV
jgi:PAS domain S-box-containing protein